MLKIVPKQNANELTKNRFRCKKVDTKVRCNKVYFKRDINKAGGFSSIKCSVFEIKGLFKWSSRQFFTNSPAKVIRQHAYFGN